VGTTSGRAVLDRLLAERPTFHYDQTQDWSLGAGPLEILVDRVRPGWRVLETGCGYTTVVLAAAGAELITVAPSPYEHEAIVAWCRDAGIPTENLHWEEATSETALPGRELGTLDLVLIDGAHAFPIPFIDWFYAGGALRPGGLLLVDDTQVPSPRLLRDFLDAEGARWRRVTEVDNCAVFERIGDAPLVGMDDWQGQSWAPVRQTPLERVVALSRRGRGVVRLRTRLRAALSATSPPHS
jgi:predicted O-methyltransferase YrrM